MHTLFFTSRKWHASPKVEEQNNTSKPVGPEKTKLTTTINVNTTMLRTRWLAFPVNFITIGASLKHAKAAKPAETTDKPSKKTKPTSTPAEDKSAALPLRAFPINSGTTK